MPSATDAALMENIYQSLDRLAAWYDSVSTTVTGLGGTLLWTRADAIADTDYENNLTVKNTNDLDEAMTIMPYLNRFLGRWLRSHKQWLVQAGIEDVDGVRLFGLNDYLADRGVRVHNNVNELLLLNYGARVFPQASVYADADTVLAQFDVANDGTGTISNVTLTALPDYIGDCRLRWVVTAGTYNPAAPLTPNFGLVSASGEAGNHLVTMAAGASGSFPPIDVLADATSQGDDEINVVSGDGGTHFEDAFKALIWGAVDSSSETFYWSFIIDETGSGSWDLRINNSTLMRWAFDHKEDPPAGANIQLLIHEISSVPANMGGAPQGASTIQIRVVEDRAPAF